MVFLEKIRKKRNTLNLKYINSRKEIKEEQE